MRASCNYYSEIAELKIVFLPKIHRKETNTIGLLSEYFVYSEKVCILYVIEEAKN